MRLIFTFLFAFCLFGAQAQVENDTRIWDEVKSYKPMLSQGRFLGEIPALRDLEPQTMSIRTGKKTWSKRNYFPAIALHNPSPLPQDGDPLYEKDKAARLLSPDLTKGLNFDGIGDLSGITPPDPVGDIGKDHYVQMVNASGGAWFEIWNKQGQSVYGPALTSTLWSTIGLGSIGDPIIQYDHAAQRWLMMEMQAFNVNVLLLAVSNTSDPTGGWKAYSFSTLGFPDYPKLYVWNDAYFVTANEIVNGNTCAGFALERSAILAGSMDFKVQRFQMPNYLGIQYQPATGVDWELGPPPPAGTPGYIMRVYDDAWDGGKDQLQMWEVKVDFADESQSSLTGPIQFFPAPFETKVCFSGLFDCIEQPDPNANRITALENIIMYRAPYQNFGDHESIVLNHVVDVSGQIGPGGDAQVRWYELRRSGNNPWQIYQQGTYGPNAKTNRFTGTLSMDERGNVGLGYSVCSDDGVFPGLRITGRRSGDPLGEMTISEYTLVPGLASHYDPRWGDYSNMAVDPEDGRTFWFTGEYQSSSGNWSTRIGTFQITRDTYDLTPTALLAPQASDALGNNETVKVQVLNSGLVPSANATISLYFEGNLVTTESLQSGLAPGSTLEHTFLSTVSMPTVGKYYDFMLITHWGLDKFSRNDTLRTRVRHLTTQDAQAVGRANFPGVICGTNYNLEFILKNAGTQPLTSVNIHYQLNSQSSQTFPWTGNLAGGAQDTVLLPLSMIAEGTNLFYLNTSAPNGLLDQDVHNDSIFFKFSGNVDGAYLEARASTNFGVLKFELRKQNNALLAAREFPPQGTVSYPLCTDDVTCYKLILKSGTLAWDGSFKLFDIFNNVLAESTHVEGMDQNFTFCTPARKQKDVGALGLLSPVSGGNLGSNEVITMQLRNFGLAPQSNIPIAYRVDGGLWNNAVLNGVLAPGETATYSFAVSADLHVINEDYVIDIRTNLSGDETPQNDQKTQVVLHRYQRDLALTSIDVGGICSDTTGGTIHFNMENRGVESIDSFTIRYQINGALYGPFQLVGAIITGQTLTFNIPIKGLTFQTNTLSVFVDKIQNGLHDLNSSNDTISSQFLISPGQESVLINVLTDNTFNETSYEILDKLGNVLYSVGPFELPQTYYSRIFCLDKDQCYSLRLKDAASNGMDGFVQISLNADLLGAYYGGDFGAYLDLPFCTLPPCEGFAATAAVQTASDSMIANGKITVLANGGALPYFYTLDGINLQSSPIFDGLLPGTYLVKVLDANQCSVTVTVVISTVGTQAPDLGRKIEVLPNPTKNLVWIALPALDQERSAEGFVYDPQGKLLQHFRLDRWDDQLRGLFSLEKHPSGNYTVRVECQKARFGARIVKE
jgi:hypothetical protein